MEADHRHYWREECLPWLIHLMDTLGKDYAEKRIQTLFAEHPFVEQEIGKDVRAAWRERFGKERTQA